MGYSPRVAKSQTRLSTQHSQNSFRPSRSLLELTSEGPEGSECPSPATPTADVSAGLRELDVKRGAVTIRFPENIILFLFHNVRDIFSCITCHQWWTFYHLTSLSENGLAMRSLINLLKQ